jgi:hypothetical protein
MIGVGEIELPVTALAATRPIAVLGDLTDVSFLASVGPGIGRAALHHPER